MASFNDLQVRYNLENVIVYLNDDTSSSNCSFDDKTHDICNETSLQCVALKARQYGRPIICTLGTFCCLLSIIVFSRKQLRTTPTCLLLLAVAVGDLFTVLNGYVPWLEYDLDLRVLTSCSFVCRLSVFACYFGPELSALLLTFMTLERCIRLLWPAVHAVHITVTKTICFIVFIGLSLVLLNINIAFSGIFFKDDCNRSICWNVFHDADDILEKHGGYGEVTYWKVHRWVAISLYWIVPAFLLPIINLVFIVYLRRRARASYGRLNEEVSELNRHLLGKLGPEGDARDSEGEISVMLVAVTLAFILLTSGFNLVQVGAINLFSDDGNLTSSGNMAFSVFILLFYLNHAWNFFLYCLSVRTYRAVCLRLCSSVCRCFRKSRLH